MEHGNFIESFGPLLEASVGEHCQFIKEQQSHYPIKVLWKMVQASRSAYYQYGEPKAKDPQEQQLEQQAIEVFRSNKRS